MILIHKIFESLCFRENIVAKPDSFAHVNDIEVIGKRFQVDFKVYERLRSVQGYLCNVVIARLS